MRWFRHSTSRWNTELVAHVVKEGGNDGLAMYGAFWLIAEVIAEECAKFQSPTATMSEESWAEAVGLPFNRFQEFLSHLLKIGAVNRTISDRGATLSIPGLRVREDDGRPAPHDWRDIRASIFERDSYTCQYCGSHGGDLHCDHVIPLCLGGSNEASNLVTACAACNMSKGSKTLAEWRPSVQ